MLAEPIQLRSSLLNHGIIFLIIAITAGALGFGVVAGPAAMIAKVLFVTFLALCVASLLRARIA